MIREKIFHLRMAFSLVWKSASKWTAIQAIFTFMQSILPLVIIFLIKLIIDNISLAISSANKEKASNELITVIIITGIVLTLRW
jgi:ATP-binding cassette subfamily B protein